MQLQKNEMWFPRESTRPSKPLIYSINFWVLRANFRFEKFVITAWCKPCRHHKIRWYLLVIFVSGICRMFTPPLFHYSTKLEENSPAFHARSIPVSRKNGIMSWTRIVFQRFSANKCVYAAHAISANTHSRRLLQHFNSYGTINSVPHIKLNANSSLDKFRHDDNRRTTPSLISA